MTTLTGDQSKLGDRTGGEFDQLVAAPVEHPESRYAERPDSQIAAWAGGTAAGTSSTVGTRRGIIVTVLVILTLIVGACIALALLESSGRVQAGPTGSADAVTAAEIVGTVEAGWADAGTTGSASCPEPVAPTPGTTVACTGVVDGAPIVFTATLGDVTAGEARFSITGWSTS